MAAVLPAGPDAHSLLDKLPLELTTTIFSDLRPIDLLTLARSSRGLRAFLLSKSSAGPIWTASYAPWRRTGLPEFDWVISEPAFAALVADDSCYLCSAAAPNGGIDRSALRRICLRCHTDRISSGLGLPTIRRDFDGTAVHLAESVTDSDDSDVEQWGMLSHDGACRLDAWLSAWRRNEESEVTAARDRYKQAILDRIRSRDEFSELQSSPLEQSGHAADVRLKNGNFRPTDRFREPSPLGPREWETLKVKLLARAARLKAAGERAIWPQHRRKCAEAVWLAIKRRYAGDLEPLPSIDVAAALLSCPTLYEKMEWYSSHGHTRVRGVLPTASEIAAVLDGDDWREQLARWRRRTVAKLAEISGLDSNLSYADALALLLRPDAVFLKRIERRQTEFVTLFDPLDFDPDAPSCDLVRLITNVDFGPMIQRCFGTPVGLSDLLSKESCIWIHGPHPDELPSAKFQQIASQPLDWPRFVYAVSKWPYMLDQASCDPSFTLEGLLLQHDQSFDCVRCANYGKYAFYDVAGAREHMRFQHGRLAATCLDLKVVDGCPDDPPSPSSASDASDSDSSDSD